MPKQVGPCRFYLLSNVQQNRTGTLNVSHKLLNMFLLIRHFIKLSIMHLTVINIRNDGQTAWHSLSPTEPAREGVVTHGVSVPCSPILSPDSHTQRVPELRGELPENRFCQQKNRRHLPRCEHRPASSG